MHQRIDVVCKAYYRYVYFRVEQQLHQIAADYYSIYATNLKKQPKKKKL